MSTRAVVALDYPRSRGIALDVARVPDVCMSAFHENPTQTCVTQPHGGCMAAFNENPAQTCVIQPRVNSLTW